MNQNINYNNYKFSPWWLTGFTQADGSFIIIIKKQERGKFGYRFHPVFELSQSVIDQDIIIALTFFEEKSKKVYRCGTSTNKS